MSSEELKPCLLCGKRPNLHGNFELGYLLAHDCRASQGERQSLVDAWNSANEPARAQLAAIQGGMGEVVEVVARLMHWKGRQPNPWKVVARTYSECASCAYPKDWEEGAQLMTVAQHQRITAAMAAEVERLYSELDRHSLMAFKLVQAEQERAALRAELDEVKGREVVPVATIEQREPYEDGTPNPCKTLRWAGNNAEDDFPAGTKLYASQPAATSEAHGHTSEAAPGVVGLVKALEADFPLLDDNGLDETLHHCEWNIQQERKRLHTALSTWRRAQEGKP